MLWRKLDLLVTVEYKYEMVFFGGPYYGLLLWLLIRKHHIRICRISYVDRK